MVGLQLVTARTDQPNATRIAAHVITAQHSLLHIFQVDTITARQAYTIVDQLVGIGIDHADASRPTFVNCVAFDTVMISRQQISAKYDAAARIASQHIGDDSIVGSIFQGHARLA